VAAGVVPVVVDADADVVIVVVDLFNGQVVFSSAVDLTHDPNPNFTH
jgi:hypothetical protein